MQIGDLFFAIRGDTATLVKDAAAGGDKAGAAFAGPFGKHFDKLSRNKGFQTVATGVGLGAGIGAWNLLGTGISAVTGLVGGSIKAASDLNEQVSKSAVIFGSSSDEVERFGDTSAKALGISKREALEAAGNFGNMFTAMGLTTDKSADMSIGMVKLASDLASFNNIGTAEALDKIRSGLTGEAEPLRTVGVLLNETTVAAEAQALGFKKVNGQYTEGQKVQARYSLILKQTTSAQGDFAKTSGSMANQQRQLAAEAEDAGAKLGKSFLPIVVQIQKALIEAAPAIEHVIEMLSGQKKAAEDDSLALKNLLPQFKSINQQDWTPMDSVIETLINLDNAMRGDTTGAQRLVGALHEVPDRADPVTHSLTDVGGAATGMATSMATATGSVITDVDKMAKAVKVDMGLTRDTVKGDIADLTTYTQDRLKTKSLRDILAGKGSLGKQLAAGLKSDLPDVRQKAEDIRDKLLEILNARVGVTIDVKQHPINKNGPGKARGGWIPRGWSGWVGEEGPEWVQAGGSALVHAADSVVSRAAGGQAGPLTMASPIGGENHFHYTIQAEGLIRAGSAFEIGDALRRLATFGVLTPPQFRGQRAWANE